MGSWGEGTRGWASMSVVERREWVSMSRPVVVVSSSSAGGAGWWWWWSVVVIAGEGRVGREGAGWYFMVGWWVGGGLMWWIGGLGSGGENGKKEESDWKEPLYRVVSCAFGFECEW